MEHKFRTTVATMRAWALDGEKTSKHVLDWLAAHTQLSGATRVVITPTEVRLADPAHSEAERIVNRAIFEANLERGASAIVEPHEPKQSDEIAGAAIDAAVADAMKTLQNERAEEFFGR